MVNILTFTRCVDCRPSAFCWIIIDEYRKIVITLDQHHQLFGGKWSTGWWFKHVLFSIIYGIILHIDFHIFKMFF
jgi:hypothetical protein